MKTVAPLKILKASAGSGKTFSLTLHYLTLLLSNENSYREILAVTFTNKATAEMKERILGVLRGLAIADKRQKIEDFRQLLLEQFAEWDESQLQQKAHTIYRKILHDYSHFTISTIDGFSQKVIRSFTYELNLDAAYKIEMNTAKVKQDLSVMLNQLLDERPDLLTWIMAFAEQKIANNENWNYRQQLVNLASLIFTENFQEFNAHLASAQVEDVFTLLNRDVQEKTAFFLDTLSQTIRTFSTTFRSLGITADELKGKTRNKLYTASRISINVHKTSTTELQKLFTRFLALVDDEDAYTASDKHFRLDIKQALQPILQQFTELYRLFPNYIGYQAVQNNLYYLRLLKEMSDLLSQWRKDNGAQLISDAQILLNRLGLDEQNDPTFIWEKIGNRYNYFLFDEFQDTSRIQWKNYSPLLINALGHSKQQFHEHLIVGDVKQSIYRWRNGDWRILLQQVEEQVAQAFHLSEKQRSDFIENGSLETNFRSYPHIIALNNYLFSSIPQKLQAVLNDKVQQELDEDGQRWWVTSGNAQMLIKAYENSVQQVAPHRQNSSEKAGSIEVRYLPVRDGRYRRNQVIENALQLVCEKINSWISSGRYTSKQIGILVRSNTQARLVIESLMHYKNKEGLDFEIISGDALSLSSNDAISLLIETLKALVYTSDKHIVYRARMAYLYQSIRKQGTFDPDFWLTFKNNDIQELAAILPSSLVAQWAKLQQFPLIHLIEQLIEIYGLHETDNIHLPYILALKDIVSAFSARGERGISQFLQYWEEDGSNASLPANGKVDAIEVTTIHKSKGLAYDVVMLPFCSWDIDGMVNGDFWIDTADSPFEVFGKIPIKYNGSVGQSIFYKQYYEEMLFNYMDALNTFYVASTRAIQHLYILAPAYKETVDKKTGEILGFDIKSEYISDMLHQVLSDSNSPFPLQNNQLLMDHSLPHPTKDDAPSQQDSETLIALSSYPISSELQNAFDKSHKRSINNILMLEKAAQYGILAHEIMSEISTEREIDALVDDYIENGILTAEDRPFILQEIHQIWHHPVINRWLTGNYKIWNEASIILENGETIRPDKVFTSDQETIVLDFKFTKGDYADHQWQIDSYKKALRNLGYSHIRGYLYYAKINELVEVE
ncbi:UvrD-helicase domain-containing protein [Sphingobacterium sp. DN00404]|uniref:DNA 3'-5' helicase n=1 Tax=Sphingobacterium micropteri TaxID=2763501 RepID=A0ABR7YUY0_9SPHI|nr:UvrD-helicase domain-containing protein [Sphingobacterium micropteri]MBD1435157.1 UvrD-helicase domain-containing protein [Sphingobacterium micropteri]